MRGFIQKVAVAAGLCWAMASAAPEVSFSGYLDGDVWGDLTGKYYTNSELDLGLALKFSEKVSSHFYATVWSANGNTPGSIPAGYAPPDERWLSVLFDGFDITFKTGLGTFAVGDLVYQYGKFNYYFYKRLSMITNESFTRGLQYSAGTGIFSQQILLGIADKNSSTADVQGVSKLTFSDAQSLGVYYGLKSDGLMDFKSGSDFYAGAEYLVNFGDMLSVKFDVGYNSLAATGPGTGRSNVVSLLLEPTLTLGSFSTAVTGFIMLDGDTLVNSAPMFKMGDEMFFYVEPGYSFNDNFAIGLPLEIHAGDLADEDDNAFWVVPTFYIYPFENVQWWIWGQIVKPLADGVDNTYGVGSEIIVTF